MKCGSQTKTLTTLKNIFGISKSRSRQFFEIYYPLVNQDH